MFASVATFSLVASMVPTAVLGQTQFNSEIQGAYDYAYANQITTVTPIDAAMPFGEAIRWNVAKMIVNWAKANNLYDARPELVGKCNGFDDMSQARTESKELADYVTMACEGGLMGLNNDGTPATSFNPKGAVTRGQFFTLLSRALWGSTYDGGDPFYQKHMDALMDAGIITQANPNMNAQRYQLWLMLMRAAETDTTDNCDDPMVQLSCALALPDCPQVCMEQPLTGNVFTGKAGMVQISLSSATPAARSVPAVGIVPVAVYTVSAGDKDIQLSSITVQRQGLGNRSDISRIYFEANGMRVSGRQTIGVDDTATVTFSPAIIVKAGSSMDLTLVTNLNGTAGGEHFFSIKSAEMVDSSAETVGGNFPIESNTFKLTNYSVLQLAFDKGGSATTYKVGDKGVELGQFKLQNNDANKSASLLSITFRNEGSGDPARSLTNLVLKRNNEVVSTQPTVVNGKYITFITKNDIPGGINATYSIVADIANVDNTDGDTYQFKLQYSDDVNAVENNTLFKSNITITNGTLPSYKVEGADVILSKPNGQMTVQTVSAGTNDVVLLKADLSVKTNVRLGDVTITFDTGSFTGNVTGYFTTLKLKIGNRIVSTVNPNNGVTFTFEGVNDVTADTTLEILGNVRSTVPGAATFRIGTIGSSNFAIKEYITNGNVVNSFIGTIQGIATTVDQTSATVTRYDGQGNSSIVRGSADKEVFGLRIRAGATSDLTITQLVMNNTGTNAFQGLASFTLFLSGQSIASATMATGGTSGKITLNLSPSVRIPRNTSVDLMLKWNFSSSLATGSILEFQFTNADIQGTDSNGNSISSVLNFPAVNSARFTITPEGSVNIAVNNNPQITAQSAMLLAANQTARVLGISFSAQNDDMRITDVFVATTGASKTNILSTLGTIRLIDGNNSYECSKVSTGGIRCDLGDSSTLVVPRNGTKEVAIEVTVANFSDSGQILNITGLQLELTGGSSVIFPASTKLKGGIYANGIRAVSINAGSTVTGSMTATITSRPHTIVRTRAVVATVGNADATNAYRFTVTPVGAQKVVFQSLVLQVSQSANNPSAGLTLHRGNVANNQIATATCAGAAPLRTCTFNIGTVIEVSSQEEFVVQSTIAPSTVNSVRSVNIINAFFADWFPDGNLPVTGAAAYGNSGAPTLPQTVQF